MSDRIPSPSRRTFLKTGFWGGLALALGGGLTASLFRSKPPVGFRVLSAGEQETLGAIASRMLPKAAAPYSHVVARTDEFLSWADASAQTEFRQLLRLFDLPFIGLPFSGRARRFSRQTQEQQDKTLAEWRDSRWLLKRSGFQALHTVLMGAFYSLKDAWAAIGYPGPPQGFHAVDTARPNGGG